MGEIGGEKIDIIEWTEDPTLLVTRALAPAKITHVTLIPEEHRVKVDVTPDQLSLAIGRGGHNVRLASALSGWAIDLQGMPEKAPETPPAEEGERTESYGE
jgi:N utilization substance protein A